jgi:adenylate kinase family enzyme
MTKVPKIIILRGNSGSGKTTIAKLLQKHLGHGTMLISQDVVRREVLYVRDDPQTQAIGLLIELVKYGRLNCDIVILEGILYADWYQELFECVINEYGSNIYAYYFDVPFEETLLRHMTKPNVNEFGENEMRRWWREKDYIKAIPEQLLNKTMTADEIVEMITQQIQS